LKNCSGIIGSRTPDRKREDGSCGYESRGKKEGNGWYVCFNDCQNDLIGERRKASEMVGVTVFQAIVSGS